MSDLLSEVRLNTNLEEAFEIYTTLETVGWRWTILDVLAQPDALLEDVIKIAGHAERVKRQMREPQTITENTVTRPYASE